MEGGPLSSKGIKESLLPVYTNHSCSFLLSSYKQGLAGKVYTLLVDVRHQKPLCYIWAWSICVQFWSITLGEQRPYSSREGRNGLNGELAWLQTVLNLLKEQMLSSAFKHCSNIRLQKIVNNVKIKRANTFPFNSRTEIETVFHRGLTFNCLSPVCGLELSLWSIKWLYSALQK